MMMGMACKKPDIEDCRRACWNYNRIMFWDKVDTEVKDMAPEQSAKIRAQRELDYREIEQREEDQGLMNCITDCQQSSNDKQVKCMLDAKTAAAVEACFK